MRKMNTEWYFLRTQIDQVLRLDRAWIDAFSMDRVCNTCYDLKDVSELDVHAVGAPEDLEGPCSSRFAIMFMRKDFRDVIRPYAEDLLFGKIYLNGRECSDYCSVFVPTHLRTPVRGDFESSEQDCSACGRRLYPCGGMPLLLRRDVPDKHLFCGSSGVRLYYSQHLVEQFPRKMLKNTYWVKVKIVDSVPGIPS